MKHTKAIHLFARVFMFILSSLLLFSCTQKKETSSGDTATEEVKFEDRTHQTTPIMGWSSWNEYHVGINDSIIRVQADVMSNSKMKAAGYTFVNIDDGFFGGRDSLAAIIAHPERFPNGMKSLADYIHSKGLKAGIYSDAGLNTCASYWNDDIIGLGMGLYGHDVKDLKLMLNEWGYDFIKVDWCGADALELDEEVRYTQIANYIKQIKPEVIYNICRWKFPGEWAVSLADSWRISGDITNTFESVMEIIDLNADLWPYCAPGHFNDMDMLQVGRGMTLDEDKAHFSMWCMMNSPLLAGNDLGQMSQQTLDILTNRELIALNQDVFAYQARKLQDDGDLEVWAKPLMSSMSGELAVALLNRSDKAATIGFELKGVGIDAEEGYHIRDLWKATDIGTKTDEKLVFEVPSHGVVVLKLKGKALPHNVFQKRKANYYQF